MFNYLLELLKIGYMQEYLGNLLKSQSRIVANEYIL